MCKFCTPTRLPAAPFQSRLGITHKAAGLAFLAENWLETGSRAHMPSTRVSDPVLVYDQHSLLSVAAPLIPCVSLARDSSGEACGNESLVSTLLGESFSLQVALPPWLTPPTSSQSRESPGPKASQPTPLSLSGGLDPGPESLSLKEWSLSPFLWAVVTVDSGRRCECPNLGR